MAEERGLVNKSTMEGIADAIRAQAETDETMQPSEMPEKIRALNVVNGVVPVEKGGTNGRTPEEACANIGALPISGGNMTGGINFGAATRGLAWTTANGTQFALRPYAGGNLFQITRKPPGGEEVPALDIDKDGNISFGGHQIRVSEGGTGAGTAADARNNLEVPHYSGDVVLVNNLGGIGTGKDPGYFWRLWNLNDGTGQKFPAALHPSQNGAQLLGTSEYRIKEVYANNYPCGTWKGSTIDVEHGGTGASDAAGARNNIGAFPTSGGSLNGSINFGATTNGLNWVTANGTQWQVRPWHDSDIFQIVRHGIDGNWYGDFTIDSDGNVSLTKPLSILHGGTGASNSADALRNLGIQYSASQPAVVDGGIWLKPIS